MPSVTSIERLALEKERKKGIEQGREQGLLEVIECVLEMRFGVRVESILREIHKLSSVEVVERILRSAKTASRLEDLSAIWPGPHESSAANDQGNGEM